MPLEEYGVHCQQCVEAWYLMVIGKMNLENVWIYIPAKTFFHFINVKK